MEILRKTQGINSFLQVSVRQLSASFSYEEKMLRNNRLKSLPPLTFQQVDDELYLLYKADGKMSLPRSWSAGGPGRTEVQRLLSDLASCVRELQDFLLSPERLVLSLPYILYDAGAGRAVFLYVPEPGPTFSESMKRLFEEIMPIYSAEREAEQIWFYDLYSRFLDDSFTPEMLLSLAAQWSRPGEVGGNVGCRTDAGGSGRSVTDAGGVSRGVTDAGGSGRSVTDAGSVSRGRTDAGGIGRGRTDAGGTGRGRTDAGGTGRGRTDMGGSIGGGIPLSLQEDPEPYILPDSAVTNRGGLFSGWRLPVGILVAALAAVLYLWLGAASFRISALLVGGYAVVLILTILSGEREKPVVCGAEKPYTQTELPPGGAEQPYTRTELPPGGAEQPSTDVLHPRIERLIPMKGEPRAPLYVSEGYCRIGRSEEENEYCIPAPAISRNHARLECVGDVVTLRDLGSTNGTYLNHMRLPGEAVAELHCGDVVSFAGEEFYVV